jgi:ribosomal protein S8
MKKEAIYLLNNIKLSQIKKINRLKVHNTKFKISLLTILYKLGYINSFSVDDDNKIIIQLKYIGYAGAIRDIRFISKPSNPVYIKNKQLKKLKKNHLFGTNGFLICSTNKGIMTDQEMQLLNLGGKLLFKI